MKKKMFFFLMVFVIMVFAVLAKFGIKGGFGFSNFSPADPIDINIGHRYVKKVPEDLFNLKFGLVLESKVRGNLFIQSELFFCGQGVTMELAEADLSLDYTIDLDYLGLSSVIKLLVFDEKQLTPYLMAGPYFAVNIKAKEWGSINGEDFEFNRKDLYKDLDFGITLGAGLQADLKKYSLQLEFAYSQGIVSILNKQIFNTNAYNRSVSIRVGILR